MESLPAPIASAQVVQEVRDYRTDHEDRIVRELAEFLAIPNVASDTPNIQRNAEQPAVYKDDWRIYARSASDDKSPIVGLLVALDAMRAKQIPMKVNLKVI